MKRLNGQREGFALVAALFGLVLVGAIVTGAFFATAQESSSGRSVSAATDAFYIAEQGVAEIVGGWTLGRVADEIPDIGDIALQEGAVDGGAYAATIRRLSDQLYFVESTGTISGRGLHSGASRTTGMVVRGREFQLPPARALQVFENTEVKGDAVVSGVDKKPAGWEDCEADPNGVPGLVGPPGTTLKKQKEYNVVGNPDISHDPNVRVEDFGKFGGFDLDDLKEMADLKLVSHGNKKLNVWPLEENGRCRTSWGKDEDWLTNWGDPLITTSPCHRYFPIIHHKGDLHLNDGKGQGILIVEGDLTLNGNIQFYGIVIVTGNLDKANGTANVNGTMMVKGQTNLDIILNGSPTIQYSSCAVKRAVTENSQARLIPLGFRSWVDLSAAGAGI